MAHECPLYKKKGRVNALNREKETNPPITHYCNLVRHLQYYFLSMEQLRTASFGNLRVMLSFLRSFLFLFLLVCLLIQFIYLLPHVWKVVPKWSLPLLTSSCLLVLLHRRGGKKKHKQNSLLTNGYCAVFWYWGRQGHETVATYSVHETFPLFKCDVSFRERESWD